MGKQRRLLVIPLLQRRGSGARGRPRSGNARCQSAAQRERAHRQVIVGGRDCRHSIARWASEAGMIVVSARIDIDPALDARRVRGE